MRICKVSVYKLFSLSFRKTVNINNLKLPYRNGFVCCLLYKSSTCMKIFNFKPFEKYFVVEHWSWMYFIVNKKFDDFWHKKKKNFLGKLTKEIKSTDHFFIIKMIYIHLLMSYRLTWNPLILIASSPMQFVEFTGIIYSLDLIFSTKHIKTNSHIELIICAQ